jgi:hypothetical protein
VEAGDGGGVNESILRVSLVTVTFFSQMRTTQSVPLMATAVSPQVLTALKAYSTWMSGYGYLVEFSLWAEDCDEVLVALAGSAHFKKYLKFCFYLDFCYRLEVLFVRGIKNDS